MPVCSVVWCVMNRPRVTSSVENLHCCSQYSGGDRDETETETRQRQRQRPREVYIHRPRYKVTHTYTTHKHTNTHTHTHNTHDPKKTEEEEEHPPAIALPAAFVPRPRDMGVAAHLVSAGLMT